MSAVDEMPPPPPSVTFTFLHMLFGHGTAPVDSQVTLSLPNPSQGPKEPRWWSVHRPASDLVAVEKAALELDEKWEPGVYFGCGLRTPGIGKYRRGRGDEVVAIPGVWCDLDLAMPGHAAGNLPDFATATELLRVFGLPPTAAVHSGGGLHVWWLFTDGLWTITDPETHVQAARLIEGLQVAFAKLVTARGLHIDTTSDLSRVLRLPGTTNKKIAGNPRPVRLMLADGPRHDRATLFARFEGEAKTKAKSAKVLGSPAQGHVVLDDKPSLLLRAFDYAGMLGTEMSDGKCTVQCPWEHEHTSGTTFDTSTIIWPPTTDSRLGYFCCLHGHCKRRTFDDVLAALPADAVKRAQTEHDQEQREASDRFWDAATSVAPTKTRATKQATKEFCQERMRRLAANRPKRSK